MRRGLGWIPDRAKRPDETPDVRYAATRTAPPPPAHSLDELVLDVLDQGSLSSCTANAAAQAIRMRHVAQGITAPPLMSRLFAYFAARSWDGTVDQDAGAMLRSVFDGLAKLGFCAETVWPYVDIDGGDPVAPFRVEPPTAAFRAAHDQLGSTSYQRIYSFGDERLVEIKQAIASGFPVVFGCGVSDDFCDGIVDATKPLPPPAKVTGQHAMVVIGYDGGGFSILNSWGKDWGRMGRCLFSGDYMIEAGDLWIVEHVPPPETG